MPVRNFPESILCFNSNSFLLYKNFNILPHPQSQRMGKRKIKVMSAEDERAPSKSSWMLPLGDLDKKKSKRWIKNLLPSTALVLPIMGTTIFMLFRLFGQIIHSLW